MNSRNKTRIAAAALPFLIFSACAELPNLESNALNIADVVSAPNLYDGKTITIVGWMSMRSENYNVWSSWEDQEQWNVTKCISLKRRFTYDVLARKFDHKKVFLTGRFYKNADVVDGNKVVRLGSCSGVAIEFFDESAVRLVE